MLAHLKIVPNVSYVSYVSNRQVELGGGILSFETWKHGNMGMWAKKNSDPPIGTSEHRNIGTWHFQNFPDTLTGTWEHGNMASAEFVKAPYRNMETWKHGNMDSPEFSNPLIGTWRHGNMETWKHELP